VLKAVVLAAGTLLRPAAAARGDTGTIQDVQHVVILMMENRSFDQYYGCLRGVRGYNDPNALLLRNGRSVFYQSQVPSQPLNTNYVLPFHVLDQCVTDVGHDWYYGHIAWNNGEWDQWIPARTPRGMIFCTRDDLSFYYALADAYTICDAYFCPIIGPTFPNRIYEFTGTIDPHGTQGGPVVDNEEVTNGYAWTTYPERLQAAGVSWKVYQSSSDYLEGNPLRWFAQFKNLQPGNPLYDRGLVLVPDLVAAFRADVTNGTLPRVAWLTPGWTTSEHPPYSPSLGQALTSQLLAALAANPAVFNSTVFMLTYDENGGFFDHVPAPTPPPGTPDEFVNGWPIGLGFRVPMLLISPWSRGGYVCSQVFDHTSIIRFLETLTGVQETNISAWRRQVCGDLTSAFDFAHPNTNYPSLPPAIGFWCGSGYDPALPSPQTFPTQELGLRPGRPLPYQPNATSALECATGRLWLTLNNSGSASVHFAVYANAFRNDGPWQYDVTNGSPTMDWFNISSVAQGRYDFTCYGPNGFQRRFAGTLNTNCSQVEATSAVNPAQGGLVLNFTNGTSSTATFTISDAYQTGAPLTVTVPPGQATANSFAVLATNSGWYDLTVMADTDATFLRRFAGHIESPLFPFHLVPATNKTVQCGDALVFDPPSASVSCSNTTLTLVALTPITNGLCPQFITQSWFATDACGNNDTCSQTITLINTNPPAVSCAADKLIPCGASLQFDVPTAVSACISTNVSIMPLSPVTNGPCRQMITQPWVVTDACGNSATAAQTITIINTNPPALIPPGDKTVRCGQPFAFDPPALAGPCSWSPVTLLALTPLTNGQCPQVITQPWLATDACGNSATCTQVVTALDVAGVLVCPTNKLVQCGSLLSFDPPTLLDGCGTNATILPLPPVTNGQCPLRITQPWLVLDGCGVTDFCTQAVTVACSNCQVLSLKKNCPPYPVPPGGVLAFSGTVSNAGFLPLTNLVVTADQPASNTVIFGPATLAPGGTASFNSSYRVPAWSCGPFTDTLTATGIGSDGITYSNSLTSTCLGTNYAIPGDLNGDGIVDQDELNAVLASYWAHSQWVYMSNALSLGGGVFQFALTNASAWNFTVLASSNLVDWTNLPGPAHPVFQFFDPGAASNAPSRFYRLRYP
jgi:phospholipase C